MMKTTGPQGQDLEGGLASQRTSTVNHILISIFGAKKAADTTEAEPSPEIWKKNFKYDLYPV